MNHDRSCIMYSVQCTCVCVLCTNTAHHDRKARDISLLHRLLLLRAFFCIRFTHLGLVLLCFPFVIAVCLAHSACVYVCLDGGGRVSEHLLLLLLDVVVFVNHCALAVQPSVQYYEKKKKKKRKDTHSDPTQVNAETNERRPFLQLF